MDLRRVRNEIEKIVGTGDNVMLLGEIPFTPRAKKVLELAVEEAHPLLEMATEKVSGLPGTDERPVWLEMNYRCDMPFQVWLLGQTGASNEVSQAIYQFVPSAEWNKIYLNLTSFLITLKQEDYRLFFRCTLPKDASGKYTQPTGTVMLDNVRLIYY